MHDHPSAGVNYAYSVPGGTNPPTVIGTIASSGSGGGYATKVASQGDTETRGKNIAMLWCVKAFGAAVNQGTVDITALAAAMNEKIGKTDTGYGTHVWVSEEYTPVNNIPTIVNHGLTIDPLKCKCEVLLKCVTAQGGYSVGDYAISPVLGPSTGGAVEYPLIPSLSATSIQINTGAYGLACCQKANGNGLGITNANWRYIFRIWY